MKELKAIDFRLFIGCQCYVNSILFDKPILSIIESINYGLNTVIADDVDYEPNLIKPILRRFESLSRHEMEQLNKLWPKENIKRTTFDSIVLDAEIINFLTLLKVDVFGWIDQGLAIDAGI